MGCSSTLPINCCRISQPQEIHGIEPLSRLSSWTKTRPHPAHSAHLNEKPWLQWEGGGGTPSCGCFTGKMKKWGVVLFDAPTKHKFDIRKMMRSIDKPLDLGRSFHAEKSIAYVITNVIPLSSWGDPMFSSHRCHRKPPWG